MILIISSPEDLSTDIVIDWLNYYKKPFFRINFLDIIDPLTPTPLHYSLNTNSLTIGKDTIDMNKITAVWFRKLGSFKKSLFYRYGQLEQIYDPLLQQSINEYTAFFTGVLENIDECHWVTGLNSRKLNKWKVLRLAQEIGLAVPTTDVVNTKDKLHSLLHSNRLITKPLKEPMFFNDATYVYTMYTKRVQEEDLSDFTDYFFPSLLQNEIEKDFEIRSFYLDDELYSMAIFSQKDPQTMVDFREYNLKNFNRYVPYQLPATIEADLISLMNKLKLNCGSIDLIKDKAGKYIFLEVNPNGQFGMVDFPCNYNLHKIMAEHLIKKSDEAKY